jgi:MFS family permease
MIWGIGTAFVLFQFLLQLSSGVLVERLMQDFAMTAVSAGFMSGAYYYIYVALQTPAGMMIDRFGARTLLSMGGLVCAAGCALFAVADHIWMADLARVLMGGGSAFAFVGTLFLINNWFPAAYFGLMLGLSDFIATIATIGANIYLATLLESVSWRTSMGGAAVLATLIALLSWIIIRDYPDKASVVPKQSTAQFRQHAKWVFTNPILWLNGIFIGVIFAIVSVFSGMWGIPFIAVVQDIHTTQATIIASMLFVGLAIGCPLIGMLYPVVRHQLRAVFVSVALLLSLLLSWIIYLPPTSLVLYGAIMVLMGMICSVYVLSFTYVKEIVPAPVQTTTIGFTNALCVGTVPIFQPLIGYLLHVSANWRHNSVGVEVYEAIDYQIALSVLPISLVIAAVLAWFIFAKEAVETDEDSLAVAAN